MAKYLNYDEFIELAKENYNKGGDGFYECVSRTDWEKEPEYWKLTKEQALERFAIAYDIDCDMQGYADGPFEYEETDTPKLHSGYRCDKCNKAFLTPKIVTDNNGYSGMFETAHWESYPLSPCCKYEFSEVTDITDEELKVAEENAYWQREQQEIEDMMMYYAGR